MDYNADCKKLLIDRFWNDFDHKISRLQRNNMATNVGRSTFGPQTKYSCITTLNATQTFADAYFAICCKWVEIYVRQKGLLDHLEPDEHSDQRLYKEESHELQQQWWRHPIRGEARTVWHQKHVRTWWDMKTARNSWEKGDVWREEIPASSPSGKTRSRDKGSDKSDIPFCTSKRCMGENFGGRPLI